MKKVIYLITIFCLVYASDSKPQWVQQTLPTAPGELHIMQCIDFNNQDHGITGGFYGFLATQQFFGSVYYTNDGGNNWMESSVPDSMRVLVDVQIFNDSLAYGAGAYNLSIANARVGSNYPPLNNPGIQSRYKLLGMNPSGQDPFRGYFVETTDGGLTWHPKGLFEDSVHYVFKMSFIDQQTGFVIGISPADQARSILKTTDGGSSWSYVYPFSLNLRINDIHFFDSQNGIAVAEESGNGVTLRTTDAGDSWIKSYVSGTYTIFNSVYLDLNNILISGFTLTDAAFIYKSTDGGISWNEFHIYGEHIVEGIETYQNSGILLSYGAYKPNFENIPFVDVSLDNGNSWTYTQYPQYQYYIFKESKMVSESRWYLAGTDLTQIGVVLFTDNSGGVPVELTSFTAQTVDGKVRLNWTTATELNNLGFGIERKYENTGWNHIGFINGNGTTTETQNYSFIDNLAGISASKIYYRLKQVDLDGTFKYSDEVEVEINIPARFILGQNYPNPFNPVTKIKYQIPIVGTSLIKYVQLKVYDILGNEIETLVNDEKAAGIYDTEFDGSKLQSGVYFYTLRAGNFTETKKMVLLK